MTTLGEAARRFQIQCLLKAQLNLARARSSFGLPEDVALEVQAIMDKIPTIVARLEGRPELAGTARPNAIVSFPVRQESEFEQVEV